VDRVSPLRGEVWDAHVPNAGDHPFVILTVNSMITRLGAVTAALVTGTSGPELTHIPLGPDAGLTGYGECYVNATDLHPIPKLRLRRRRGRLHPAELRRVEGAVRAYLGL
jgi:mRNA interferase MazF